MIYILTQRALKLGSVAVVKVRRHLLAERLPAPQLYYFGYGANLDLKRFQRYKMNVVLVGVAKLEKHALKFNFPCEYLGKGYASVEVDPAKEVWGMLYRIDQPSLFLLDVMEWAVMNQYRRTLERVTTKEGKVVEAFVYKAKYPREGLFPSAVYKNLILKAAKEHGFPKEYLAQIEGVESRDSFALDPGFSFIRPNRRRLLERYLKKPYLWHDRLREILADKLRF